LRYDADITKEKAKLILNPCTGPITKGPTLVHYCELLVQDIQKLKIALAAAESGSSQHGAKLLTGFEAL
jgi:hypothetical protein